MRWLDLPPFWLLGCLILARISPWGLPWGPLPWLGVPLIVLAVALTLAALAGFRAARTTFVPRRDPAALVTGGIFRVSRNPIYLADLLILAGFSLYWGRLLGLLLLPLLLVVLERRFILGEEARLRAAFGDAYERYAAATRRWI